MKLIFQISAGILLAALIGVGLVTVPLMLAKNQTDSVYTNMEIDCTKRYSVERVEAERLRRCQ